MKTHFEKVTFAKGCSLRVYLRQIEQIPFEWHHHPEYELTLTLNSQGWRFVGDHIGQYSGADLVLIPPDMPHTWASTARLDSGEPHTAIVTWFSRQWLQQLIDLCPEYAAVRKLLQHAATGLMFDSATAEQFAQRSNALLVESPAARLQVTLESLLQLAHAAGKPLSTGAGSVRSSADGESAQLNRVLNHLHKAFHEQIRIADLCAAANCSPRSLHRLFLKHVGESVGDYLCKLRIGRACMRLVESDAPVSMIADEVGLANLANFNRHFRRLRRMTPTAYRKSVHKLGTTIAGDFDEQTISDRPKSLERRVSQQPRLL